MNVFILSIGDSKIFQTHGAKIFYFKVEIEELGLEGNYFPSNQGLYRFTIILLGLNNASVTF